MPISLILPLIAPLIGQLIELLQGSSKPPTTPEEWKALLDNLHLDSLTLTYEQQIAAARVRAGQKE